MTVYCDSTPFFTDEECDQENLTELEFPKSVVRSYYNEQIYEPTPYCSIKQCEEDNDMETSFKDWLNSYTADDTVGLYPYAINKGCEITRYGGVQGR